MSDDTPPEGHEDLILCSPNTWAEMQVYVDYQMLTEDLRRALRAKVFYTLHWRSSLLNLFDFPLPTTNNDETA
jgi:hypothetical protein